MDFSNLDYNRLAKVALAGAATAVVADIIRSQYGEEFTAVVTQFQTFLADVLQAASDGNTPSPSNVNGGTT